MTSINRLTNKPDPVAEDLVPIWDSEAGRTRNVSVKSLSDFYANTVNPVTNISFEEPNLKVTYADGTVSMVDISTSGDGFNFVVNP